MWKWIQWHPGRISKYSKTVFLQLLLFAFFSLCCPANVCLCQTFAIHLPFGIFFKFYFSLVDTRCYISFRCTTQRFTFSIGYAVLTTGRAAICHRTMLLQYLWLYLEFWFRKTNHCIELLYFFEGPISPEETNHIREEFILFSSIFYL